MNFEESKVKGRRTGGWLNECEWNTNQATFPGYDDDSDGGDDQSVAERKITEDDESMPLG